MSTSSIPRWLQIFIPTKEVKVTPVILSANVVMWLIMIATGVSPVLPTTEEMRAWGGTSSTDVINGDYWRLFTSNYLHYGIIHLAANMFSFNSLGRMLEQFIGPWRLAAIYTVSGICGSAVSIWWNPFGLGAGASGAILGVVGILLALLTTNLIEKTARMSMLRSMAISAGLMILIGMQSNVDNAAHLGGLCAGMLGGYFIFPELKAYFYQKKKQFLGLIAACLLTLGASGWFVMNATSPFAYYRTIQQMFSDADAKRIAAETNYDNGLYTTAEAIDKNVTEAYRYNLRVLDTIAESDLNSEATEYYSKVRAFMEARKTFFEFTGKLLSTGDSVYVDSAQKWEIKSETAFERMNAR